MKKVKGLEKLLASSWRLKSKYWVHSVCSLQWTPVTKADKNYLTTLKHYSDRWLWWCQTTNLSQKYFC